MMVRWTLLTLMVLFSLCSDVSSFAEDISPHVHAAANDHWIVFARNRDQMFYFTLSPYEASPIILHLDYASLGTEAVRTLSIPAYPSNSELIELAFIGRARNSSEPNFYFAKLQKDGNKELLSIVHSFQTPIVRLSSFGIEPSLGIHPLSTLIFVVGDRAAYVCDANKSHCYEWLIWNGSANGLYPKTVSVTMDSYVVVGVNIQMIDTVVPTVYIGKFDFKDMNAPAKFFTEVTDVEITSVRSAMSIAVLGSINKSNFTMVIGFPSVDTVLLVLDDGNKIIERIHQSTEKGINFGHAVVIIDSNTYGVLSTALVTPPWSTGRVQFFPILTAGVNSSEVPLPLFVYPNNQQHYPCSSSTSPSRTHLVSLFSWTDGFGVILSRRNVQYALLLPTSSPGYVSVERCLPEPVASIIIGSFDQCMSGTYKSTWGSGPCRLCPARTLNNGSSGIQCNPCDTDNKSLSSICFRGATHRIDRQRLIDREQADAFPDSPDWSEFDDVLLNYVFHPMSTSNWQCLSVRPMFWATIAIGIGLIFFVTIILLGHFPKRIRDQTLIKSLFTHLDLVGEGQLWFGGLVTLVIVVLVVFTCKFSVSFTDLYPIESISSNTYESVSCDSTLTNAKFSSSLKLLAIRKHREDQPIFDMLDEQNITLTVEFISTGFQCSNVQLQRNLARGQQQQINDFNCSYDDDNDDILIVSSVLSQHFITIQVNLEGPFFVGGLRICLSAPETVATDGIYTVKSLKFCHFVYTPDQVLSIDPVVNIEMTKVINRTAAVNVNTDNRDTFSGIWLPTWTDDKSSLWDSHIYTSQMNEYRRSLNWQLALIFEMRQSKFYVKNVQEPIARGYEVAFKTVLFSMLFLDLFGLLFLIAKMAFKPLLCLTKHKANCCCPFARAVQTKQTNRMDAAHLESTTA